MQYTDRIEGENRLKVFKQLQRDKTVMRLYLVGRNYERLTIVNGIRNQNGALYFLIDYPAGFKEAVQGNGRWRIRFEFTGKERVSYAFRTVGGELSGNEIWLAFPEVIERQQRRRHFRLEAPLGTEMRFRADDLLYKANVIDISLGGSLVSLEKSGHADPILKKDQRLKEICVAFKSRKGNLKVQIKTAMVIRLEKDPAPNRCRYALQFTDMEKGDEITLNELIYGLQRQSLRKRHLLDG